MGLFKSEKTFFGPISLLPEIAGSIEFQLKREGYEVQCFEQVSGGYDISITKGGAFKALLGMKSALKVKIEPHRGNKIYVEASVGIFGQQAIPTAITLLVAWPVIIAQVWGLVKQSKLDNEVMAIVEACVRKYKMTTASGSLIIGGEKVCTGCGRKHNLSKNFCSSCGHRL